MNKAKRAFENIAFRKSVNLTIKQKIDSISNLSENAGFTAFDWFRLSSHIGLTASLELSVYFLLLVQVIPRSAQAAIYTVNFTEFLRRMLAYKSVFIFQTYYLYTLGFYNVPPS